MRVNKVELGDEVMFDLNADTVSEDSLIAGTTAHNAVGEPITGTVVVAPIDNELSEESENPVQNKIVTGSIYELNARVDNLATLPEVSNTVDAELIDIRVGADGKTYQNAGEAVRTQLGELKNGLNNLLSTHLSISTQEDISDWTVSGLLYEVNKITDRRMMFVLISNQQTLPSVTIRGLVGGTYSGNAFIMNQVTFNGNRVCYGFITPTETETRYWLTTGSARENVHSILNIYEYTDDLTDDEILSLLKNMSKNYTINVYGEILERIKNDVEIAKETACDSNKIANEALNGKPQTKIVCWGDSLTQGVGATTNGGYVTLLQNQLIADGYSYTTISRGVAGDNLNNIMNRQGAVPIYIKPFTMSARSGSNIYIPIEFYDTAFGKVQYQFPFDINAGIRPCRINGKDLGGIAKDTDGSYLFLRTVDGDEIVYDKPAYLTFDNQLLNDQITVIWGGTNDIGMTAEEMILRQKAMVEYLKTEKYVIIGLVVDIRHDVQEYNKEMSKQWGKKFLDVQKYLVEFGLSDNGITPTEDDLVKIAEGKIPRSIMAYDQIHFNEYGYNAIKNCLYTYLVNEGYIKK